jgi:hypothetical protein
MSNTHVLHLKISAKLIFAFLMLIGIAVIAAQDLAPNITYAKLFAYIFLGLAALAVNLVGLSVIYLNVYQWVLRKGGTDTSWFWFNTEPKGLMAMKDKLRKN